MSIIVYKLKKKLSDIKLSQIIIESIGILLAFILFSSFAAILYSLLLVLICSELEIPMSDYTFNIIAITLATLTVGILMYFQFHVSYKDETEIQNKLTMNDTQQSIERDVEKVIRMMVVSKKEVVTQHGEIVRELMLKDHTGRVIPYGKNYYQKNLNTVYFNVEEGSAYDFEWNLEVYEPTGKQNEYYKIMKIEDKDVDLNH